MIEQNTDQLRRSLILLDHVAQLEMEALGFMHKLPRLEAFCGPFCYHGTSSHGFIRAGQYETNHSKVELDEITGYT